MYGSRNQQSVPVGIVSLAVGTAVPVSRIQQCVVVGIAVRANRNHQFLAVRISSVWN